MVKTTYGTDILALYSILFCYFLSSAKCELNITKDPKVYGGTRVTDRTKFAYQALLLVNEGSGYYPNCGGTIISSVHVLTSAHCVKEVSPDPKLVQVVAGNLDLLDHKIIKDVQKVYVHEQFTTQPAFHNDIALLKLMGGFTWSPNVQPIDIKTDLTTSGDCIVSGFGVTEAAAKGMAPHLMYAELYIVDWRICGGGPDLVSKNTICAAGPQRSFCFGDSGGPLACSGKLVGLVAGGRGCGEFSGGKSCVEVAKYLGWIKDHGGPNLMSDNSTTSPASPTAPPFPILNFVSLLVTYIIYF